MLALRKISVHAYEDPGRPEGGHAVLLLHGVANAPADPTFRLKPADAGAGVGTAGWPQGDLKPLACRPTAEGLEVQIGPDITESELLLPGTLVEIELPDGGVRGEFLWPNIAPVLRPKKRTVIVNTPRRQKETQKEGDKDAGMNAGKGEPDRSEAKGGATDATARPAGDEPKAAQAEPSAALAALAAIESIADSVTAKPRGGASDPLAALDAIEAIAETAKPKAAGTPGALAALDAIESIAESAAASAAHTEPATPAAPAGPAAPSTSLRAAARKAADPAADTPAAAAPPQDPAFYPHARAGRVSGAPKTGVMRSEPGSRRASNALQAVTGLLAVLAALYVLSRESSMRTVAPQPASDGSSIVLPSSTAPPAPSFTQAPPPEQSLFDTLSVGAISPRGTSAASTTATRALENANAQLSGVNRDTEEAAFWLRRYITGTLGNDRTTRALTQLGSVYAEPVGGGAPDYAKARLLWELASAAGDPVAMCFLGLLSENGLGGAVDRRAALQWYERSKQAGGCPQVDASIARVRQ